MQIRLAAAALLLLYGPAFAWDLSTEPLSNDARVAVLSQDIDSSPGSHVGAAFMCRFKKKPCRNLLLSSGRSDTGHGIAQASRNTVSRFLFSSPASHHRHIVYQ